MRYSCLWLSDSTLKSTYRCKKRSCFSGEHEVNVRQFQPLISVSSVGYASLRSRATRSSGSVVVRGLDCFSGPGCTVLATQSWGDVHGGSVGLHFVTDTRQQPEKLFPLFAQGRLKFWACSCVIMKKDL